MKKVAHFFYGDGNELQIFNDEGVVRIRDGQGRHPISPVTKARGPHPKDGRADFGCVSAVELGLYYAYDLTNLGWGGL